MIENELVLKFLKFCIVGGSGVFVDFGFTYLFKEIFKIHRYIANSFGFILAASGNYFFNRVWTFRSNDPDVLYQYASFIFVSLIGLVINNFFLYLFENKIKLNFYVAKLGAIGVTTIWNFAANYVYTFT